MLAQTCFTKILKIKYPIIQGPMAGGATTPELVAAVSNSGALGSLGAGYMPAGDIKQAIYNIRKLTDKPFAVNLFIPEKHQASQDQISHMQQIIATVSYELNIKLPDIAPPFTPNFDEQMNVIYEEKVPIFSFTFGIPDARWVPKLKSNGTICMGTATNIDEALHLEKNGIDIIVAQGSEAGGHRGTFFGKAENSLIEIAKLVPLLVHHLNIPVIAAGGIMNAEQIATMLALGANAVQMGTAFLTCPECGIHPNYKTTLLNATQDKTTLTRAFSGKLARGINNKFIKQMQEHTNDILDYPIQNALTRTMRKAAEKQNAVDFMSMWAGQAAYLSKGLPVEQLIKMLVNK